MSVRTVAWKDFTSATRSRSLWAVGTLLAMLFAIVGFAFEGYGMPPSTEIRQVFATMTMVLAVLVPIVALVASYMAIAGERERGGIKFLLGFPNTRRDVFVGKFLSRLAVVAGGLAFVFLTATAVASAKHGVLPVGLVAGLFALTLVYAAVFVAVAVGLSAAVGARSRAIAAAIGAYFGLVILYVVPVIRVSGVVRGIHTRVLGMEPNVHLYSAVEYTSPFIAYRKATNLVFPEQFDETLFYQAAEAPGGLPAYLTDEFALVIFAVWLVVPLVLGYRRFRGADLE